MRPTVLLIATAILLLSAPDSAGLQAQDADKPDRQPGLADDVKVLHTDDPVFRFLVSPKKKKTKKLAALWRSVDPEVRLKAIVDQYDKQISDLEKQDPQPTEQIQQIYQRKIQATNRFKVLKCLLEVKGDNTQSVSVFVQPYSSGIDDAVKASKAEFGKWSGVKYHIDQNITTKREGKGGVHRHVLDLVGTPPKAKEERWVFIERMIRPGKGGKKFLVTYVQNRSHIKRTKAGLSDAKLLHSCLSWR